MRLPKRFPFLLFVLSGVLAVVMAACQAAPQASPSPTGSPMATATVRPSPVPSATPTVPPTPAPHPSPTVPRPFPPLPKDATLPWDSPPLPALHGALDNPAALRQALQESLRYDLEAWVAAWPEALPTEVPWPQEGWLVLATREYMPYGDGWSLYLDIPQAADAWKEAYQALLQQQGWKQAPSEGGGLGVQRVEIRWCSPSEDKEVSFVVATVEPGHAVARVSYQPREKGEGLPCEPSPLIVQPPKDAPALQVPEGTRAVEGEGSSGGPGEWVFKRRFSSPQGIAALVGGFSRQLSAQGWQILTQAQAKMNEGEAAVIRASKKDASLPNAMLLVVGKAPLFDVWLWNGVVGMQPSAPPRLASPDLHGRTDDVLALRRALALSHWDPYFAKPREVWVATAPSSWPQGVPRPPEATWRQVQKTVYPDDSRSWKIIFSVPQSPAQAKSALGNLLAAAGWKATPFPQMEADEAGFVPPSPPVHFDLFCGAGSASLMANYTKTPSGHTRVQWEFSTTSHACLSGGRWHDRAQAHSAPIVQLVLGSKVQESGGGLSLIGNEGFSRGYVAYSSWWAGLSPAAQGKAFAGQLQAKKWQMTGQGALGEVGYWLQAIYTAPDGRRWHADVVITIIDKQYTYGVLRVLPATP